MINVVKLIILCRLLVKNWIINFHNIVTELIMPKGINCMKFSRYTKVSDNIYHIYESLGVYCTLIVGSTSALLIDTGYGFGNIYSAVKEITDLPLQIINTHGHVDHIQGNKFFNEVMIHSADKKVLKISSSFIVKTMIFLASKKQLSIQERNNIPLYFQKNRQQIKYIENGDIIDLGNTILEILHTPGHTLGSICLLDRTHRILFSGDSISSHVWLFLKESAKLNTYIESLNKVISHINDFDFVLSSHSTAVFKSTIVSKMLHCANNIDITKSRKFNNKLNSNALLYCEGFEKFTSRYGYKDFDEFISNVSKVSPEDIADIAFVSIAYSKDKLV